MSYKLTYSTMFDPPPQMHERFDAALQEVGRGWAAGTHSTSMARMFSRTR